MVSEMGTVLTAGNNLTIEAATNTSQSSAFHEEKKSGLMSGGGIGITYGNRQLSQGNQGESTSAAASTVGSVGGNVSITSGQTYTQIGSDVITPQGNIDIVAKSVTIEEARESNAQTSEQKFKQSGITLALSGGIIDMTQSTLNAAQGATSGSNSSKALNVLTAYAKGSDLMEQGKAVANAYDQNGITGSTSATGDVAPGASAASGIKVSISVGSSASQSTSQSRSDSAAGSTAKAGGNVNIHATEGDITVQGSNVQAAGDVVLQAAKDVNIVASADQESNQSTNSSSSASLGVSFGVGSGSTGFSVDVAASRGKGQANSDSTTYNNSHIAAGNTAIIQSGGDTNVIGGDVMARQVQADVGGDLTVQSLQDIATSNAKQSNTGFAASIPIGAGSGSVSVSQSKQSSNSNYQSVGEQSGIMTGDGGFQINVAGNTGLKGGVMASTAEASKNSLSTQSLTTEDMQNTMIASASSSGVSLGSNMLDGKYQAAKVLVGNALNHGDASQNDRSTTRSAISTGLITVGGLTTDTSQAPLTDSKGNNVNTDTTNTNRTLAKTDVVALQGEAQQEQADNILAFSTAASFTDEAFRKAFLEEATIYRKVRGTDANGEPYIAWEIMTPEEKANIPQGSHIANNGIFNGGPDAPQAAQNLAQQNNNAEYLIHFPEANNIISELMIAGYQKYIENGTLGLSKATQENVDLWLQTGGKINLDGHSRGGMTVGNAIEYLDNIGASGDSTQVNLFGSAYNAQEAANMLNKITHGAGQVYQSTHDYDFVGREIGGNAGTGGIIPRGSSFSEELLKTFGGAATVHNCYGEGHKGCDGYGESALIPITSNQDLMKGKK